MPDLQWYYELNGQQAGPVSWDQLDSWLKEEKIQKSTLVWATHLSEWTPISIVAGTQKSLAPILPVSNLPSEALLGEHSKKYFWNFVFCFLALTMLIAKSSIVIYVARETDLFSGKDSIFLLRTIINSIAVLVMAGLLIIAVKAGRRWPLILVFCITVFHLSLEGVEVIIKNAGNPDALTTFYHAMLWPSTIIGSTPSLLEWLLNIITLQFKSHSITPTIRYVLTWFDHLTVIILFVIALFKRTEHPN